MLDVCMNIVDEMVGIVVRVVNVFIFFKNDRFVMKTTTKIEKRNDRF